MPKFRDISTLLDTDPDVLKQLLADKRSENTRRAYERDVNDFL
jgi:integrase/recombinase XerC